MVSGTVRDKYISRRLFHCFNAHITNNVANLLEEDLIAGDGRNVSTWDIIRCWANQFSDSGHATGSAGWRVGERAEASICQAAAAATPSVSGQPGQPRNGPRWRPARDIRAHRPPIRPPANRARRRGLNEPSGPRQLFSQTGIDSSVRLRGLLDNSRIELSAPPHRPVWPMQTGTCWRVSRNRRLSLD